MSRYEIILQELRNMRAGVDMSTTINHTAYHTAQAVRAGEISQAEAEALERYAVERAINKAQAVQLWRYGWRCGAGAEYTPTAPAERQQERRDDIMRRYVREGRSYATMEALARLSRRSIPQEPRAQTALYLRRYEAGEVLAYRRSKAGADDGTGTPAEIQALALAPEVVSINACGRDEAGRWRRKTEYMGRLRYILLECDGVPLPVQCAFWAGVLLSGALPFRLRSIVYSGRASLHAVAELPAVVGRGVYSAVCNKLGREWGAVGNMAGVDCGALIATASGRLAGALRAETGERQRLLYAD